MSITYCTKCKIKIFGSPFWCIHCEPGHALCINCMTVNKDGELICKQCFKQFRKKSSTKND